MRETKLSLKLVAIATMVAFVAGCSSTTVIKSNPSGAKLYLNGEAVGVTPYTMTDSKIIGSSTTVRLTKEGYEDYNTVVSRSEEIDPLPAILGFVPCTAIVPWLWAMKYKPERTYELDRKR